jgi:LPPG:FO 2-phospho-L-lactate transferase
MNIVALAGGVGGAKLADGLQRVVGEALTVIVNTGDDFELHGLYISPDLDTVMYTLAGMVNPETGWGIAGDTFNTLEMISDYGEAAWFKLGDRDLATHILRTRMLYEGRTLTQVTRALSDALGVRATILPMTDERVATMVETIEGELTFQEYFVHRRWQPVVKSVRFMGIQEACPSTEALRAIDHADAIVLCPSNPFVSIEPILSLQGMRELVRISKATKIAVSPIVGGQAIRGPAAKMFRELGVEPSATAVARRYAGLVNAFVVDKVDEHETHGLAALGMQVLVSETVMASVADRERVGREIVNWATGSVVR